MPVHESGHLLISVLIILFSSTLFVYWFRYMCLLVLKERGGSEFAARMAGGQRLQYLEVERLLAGEPPPVSLDPLREAIESDYRVLRNLLRMETPANSLETRLLRIDFLLMRGWYLIMRPVSGERASRALAEMSSIVGYLASEI